MEEEGGIASGKTRRYKAHLRQQLEAHIKMQNIIDNMSDEEFEETMQDYTPKQQEFIRLIFKPTPKEEKQQLKKFKKYFHVK